MKRSISLWLTSLCLSAFALAQTPQEIVSRMESELDKHEDDGVGMVVDVKVPVIGVLSTKTYLLGDKTRAEVKMKDVAVVNWSDGQTVWTYNSQKNEVTIEKQKSKDKSESENDMELFDGIAEGYDLSLDKETDKAWFIHCKKQKANKDKDAPKARDIVVSKADYHPLSLSAKVAGVNMTIRDISLGVTEKQVTFDAAEFPGATIVDKR